MQQELEKLQREQEIALQDAQRAGHDAHSNCDHSAHEEGETAEHGTHGSKGSLKGHAEHGREEAMRSPLASNHSSPQSRPTPQPMSSCERRKKEYERQRDEEIKWDLMERKWKMDNIIKEQKLIKIQK